MPFFLFSLSIIFALSFALLDKVIEISWEEIFCYNLWIKTQVNLRFLLSLQQRFGRRRSEGSHAGFRFVKTHLQSLLSKLAVFNQGRGIVCKAKQEHQLLPNFWRNFTFPPWFICSTPEPHCDCDCDWFDNHAAVFFKCLVLDWVMGYNTLGGP